MLAGVSRARAFTATWPAYAPATDLAVASRAESGHGQPGPYCQVEIRRVVPASAAVADARSETDAGGDVVFLERRLPLRSYNSVFLSDDGTYSLTLADCHGFATIPRSSREQNALLPPPYMDGRPDKPEDERSGGGFRGPVETFRLVFLPLPHSIEFSVESGQVGRGRNPVVGNFHLLPVAHMPHLLGRAGHGQSMEPAQSSSHAGVLRTARAATAAAADGGGDQPFRNEHGGGDDGFFCRAFPPRPSCRGCFVFGAAVGIIVGVLSAWLRCIWMRMGGGTWERFRSWFVGADGGETGRRGRFAEEGVGAEGGVTAGEGKTRGQRAASHEHLQTGDLHVIRGGAPSEDGSSDSDAILGGTVPEPVGLPRSEEDWRALFDTLYDDRLATDAAEAGEIAPLAPEASDGGAVDAAHGDAIAPGSPPRGAVIAHQAPL